MSKYYYLIAGLPELALEDNKLNYTTSSFREELYPELSSNDKAIIDLLYLEIDNQNLLLLLNDKNAAVSKEGVYTSEDLVKLIEIVRIGEDKAKGFPLYMVSFLENYFSEKYTGDILLENILTGLYYDFAMKCKNKFVKEWYEFNAILNNLFIAISSRKHQIDYQDQIIGSDSIAQQIRQSSARDFGLGSVLDYLPAVMRISEEENLLMREKKTDMLKWNWMEDQTFFNYFTIERIFVFLLQISMIERWLPLDTEEGNRYFREIINSLKNQVQIPEEFRK